MKKIIAFLPFLFIAATLVSCSKDDGQTYEESFGKQTISDATVDYLCSHAWIYSPMPGKEESIKNESFVFLRLSNGLSCSISNSKTSEIREYACTFNGSTVTLKLRSISMVEVVNGETLILKVSKLKYEKDNMDYLLIDGRRYVGIL